MNKKYEVIIITVLFLFGLWLWSLPYQENRMPYGEVDAGSHFTLGDYMALTDEPIVTLPYFIDKRYGNDNFYKPHHLWYHPPYHVNFAILQIIGGERILPTYLFNTILSIMIILIIFFVIRQLFGFWVGFMASLLMIFSLRDILVYIWGQWPQQISYFYTPLILYVFYKYACSYLDGKVKAEYAYMLAILLGVNFYLHPVGSFHTVIALIFFSLFLLIKEKKIPFSIKHISISVLIFIIMIALFPLQTASVFVQMKGVEGDEPAEDPLHNDFSGLFSWFPWKDFYSKEVRSQPEYYFNYSSVNGGFWTLPLLLIGLFYVLARRKRKDLLLLAFLCAIYFMIHLAIFGPGRPERSLAASAHVFYPLIAIGVIALPSLIRLAVKIPKNMRIMMKYALVLLFIIFVFSFNFKPAYSQLKDAYGGLSRITNAQYDAAMWMKDNVEFEADTYSYGVIMMQKDRWLRYISWRYIRDLRDDGKIPDYVLIDYSDYAAIGDNNKLQEIAGFENSIKANNTLVYDKNRIKVYKIEAWE